MGDTQTTQTSNNSPWGPAQPLLQNVLGKANTALDSGQGFNNPGFNTVVPFSPQTTQAMNQTESIANQGNPLAGQSMSALSGILQGNENPYWKSTVDKQAASLGDDLARQYSGQGRFGSAAMDNGFAQQVGDFRNQALSSNWNANVQNQLNAVQAAPGAYGQQFLPSQQLAQVGAQNEDLATRTLNDQLQRFQTDQQGPWNRLATANALGSGAGQFGSTTGTASQPFNPLQAAGAGLTGVGALAGK
jgi:hypothetical protein